MNFAMILMQSDVPVPDFGAMLVGLLAVVLAIAAYFLPTIIASGRGHNNQGAICVLNLFLGWTVLGWLVALIWSASDNTGNRPPQVIYVMQPASPPPPQMPMNGGQR